jgi:hypothetical protein
MASEPIGRAWARSSRGEEKKAAESISGEMKTSRITSGGKSISGNAGTSPNPKPPRTKKIG